MTFSFRTATNNTIVFVDETRDPITTLSLTAPQNAGLLPITMRAELDHNELRILRDELSRVLVKYEPPKPAPRAPIAFSMDAYERAVMVADLAAHVASGSGAINGIAAPDVAMRAVMIAEEIMKRCGL